jgi:hypothetical protein
MVGFIFAIAFVLLVERVQNSLTLNRLGDSYWIKWTADSFSCLENELNKYPKGTKFKIDHPDPLLAQRLIEIGFPYYKFQTTGSALLIGEKIIFGSQIVSEIKCGNFIAYIQKSNV